VRLACLAIAKQRTIMDNEIETSIELSNNIDIYGDIYYQIKRLERQLDDAKSFIKLHGAGQYSGQLFAATVYDIAGRESTDWHSVAIRFCEINGLSFSPSDQLIRAHTLKSSDSIGIKAPKKLEF